MCNLHCTYLLYRYNVYIYTVYIVSVTLPCLWNIIQLMQYYPSKYDPLHVEKSYSTPKLEVEITSSAAKHPFFHVICRHNLKTPPSKADDVIKSYNHCLRPFLPAPFSNIKNICAAALCCLRICFRALLTLKVNYFM